MLSISTKEVLIFFPGFHVVLILWKYLWYSSRVLGSDEFKESKEIGNSNLHSSFVLSDKHS